MRVAIVGKTILGFFGVKRTDSDKYGVAKNECISVPLPRSSKTQLSGCGTNILSTKALDGGGSSAARSLMNVVIRPASEMWDRVTVNWKGFEIAYGAIYSGTAEPRISYQYLWVL